MQRTLIRLHRGYGLGDSVQFSIVLQHLLKHRPDWQIDFVSDHPYRVLPIRAFDYDHQPPASQYDKIIDCPMYDNTGNWTDKPNTRAVACLYERFGIPYDPECGRYHIDHENDHYSHKADAFYESIGCSHGETCWNAVICHFAGKTNPAAKDLPLECRQPILDAIRGLGYVPILLGYSTPNGGNITHLHALISSAAAFVGIDSGPGKVASATATPSLICWTGHHPLRMHDPAPNTVHLVPENHAAMEPICWDAAKLRYFEKAYRMWTYPSECLAYQVDAWLQETLA